MEIAIASDIHDNLANLKKFLDFAEKKKIKLLILCGDTGTNKETWDFLKRNFPGRICAVAGNLDNNNEELSSFKELSSSGLEIAVTHFPAKAQELAAKGKYDFVFYGHTHKPWVEQVGKTILANPGNLAGIYYKATFALLNLKTKKLTLKILERL